MDTDFNIGRAAMARKKSYLCQAEHYVHRSVTR
jgi:hypothetical protein